MSRIGDVPGAAAVEHGQWIGATLMRLLDVLFAFPLVLLAIALAAVLVLGIVLMQLRRMMRESDRAKTQGLLLDDLRRLRDEGLLSAEEYQKAVDAITPYRIRLPFQ